MNLHEKYMKRCLELAQKGFGKVAPNPLVGCVIVYKGKVIGEGFHKQYGSGHAEVNAIKSVKAKHRAFLKEATLYINLEPCSHFGKTPPCADLIISSGFKYVVIGTIDPNPLVSGKGLKKLISSGCDVKVGVLESECRELNKRFFTFYWKKRPYVILKWAQTEDGFIGAEGRRLQITEAESSKLVHRWRSEEQAIMVGTTTALVDDPKLTVRKVKGNNPIRILIDNELKVPSGFHLLDGSVPTIVFTSKQKASRKNIDYVTIDFKKNRLKQVMRELHRRNIHSLIVEGGAKLLNSFIETGLWDEARIFTGKKKLSEIGGMKASGVEAPKIAGRGGVIKKSGGDRLQYFSN